MIKEQDLDLQRFERTTEKGQKVIQIQASVQVAATASFFSTGDDEEDDKMTIAAIVRAKNQVMHDIYEVPLIEPHP